MATFSELQDRVATAIIDTPTAVQTQIPNLVREALREAENRHNFKVMEKETVTLTTVASTRLIATITDFKEVRGKPYLIPSVGRPLPLIYAPHRLAILRHFSETETGVPVALLQQEPADDVADTAKFEVWPLSDSGSDYSGGEYRLRIPYYRHLPALSADSDTNWFTSNMVNWLVNKAAAEGFALDHDDGNYAIWIKRAENEWFLFTQTDKKQQVAALDTFVPHWEGANDTELPTGRFNPPFNPSEWF